MTRDKQFVITINRELGSGGRTVGKRLAERLEVKFYDKAVLKALKEKFHLTTEEIEKLKGNKDGWAEFQRRVVPFAEVEPGGTDNWSDADFITTDEVFKVETEIISGITSGESCVIMGRSAFYVLKDHPNHLSVLIQAPMEQRIERVMKRQKLSREEAIKAIKKVDDRRETYVQTFCKTSRYDTRNYDLVISMEHLKEEDAVDIIMDYIYRQSK